MKKFLLLLLSTLFLISCSDPNMKKIEAEIQKNYFGGNIGFEKGKISNERDIKFSEVISIYKGVTGDDPSKDIDSQIKVFKDGVELRDNPIEKKPLIGKYKILESWKDLKTEDIAYKIYTYDYEIYNVHDRSQKMKAKAYAIFDGSDNLITLVPEESYEETKKDTSSADYAFLIEVMKAYADK